MKIKTIKTKEYTFNEAEMKVIKRCLNYAFHRLERHNHSGLHGIVKEEELDNLREGLGIA